MRTVRRLYFYAVALVSLEVVLWGVIGLARTIFNGRLLGGSAANLLAGPLALVVVGLPVFLFHWNMAQRDARGDNEERFSRVRALFLYGALGGILVPCVQNLLALLNRLAVQILGTQGAPLMGAGHTWPDNLVAIVVNLGAYAYFRSILAADWETNQDLLNLRETRRLYRYLWLFYSLGIVILGVQQILRFIFFIPAGQINPVGYLLANGLALVLVGVPIWIFTWQVGQRSLAQSGESDSILRLVTLYILALAGVVTVLAASGVVLAVLLRWVLGEAQTVSGFFLAAGSSLSIAFPLGGIWAYYGHQLKLALNELPSLPRQAALRRLYTYILSALGLAATFIGMQRLLDFIVTDLTAHPIWGSAPRANLASALAVLVVGVPTWWLNWRSCQTEAAALDDTGDHARRSVIRKAYLYLALFAGVVGAMVSGGWMIFTLLSQFLGQPVTDFTQVTLNWFQTFALFSGWLTYHVIVLRQDSRLASQALATRHAGFPVLVLDPGNETFAAEISAALHRLAPAIPVTIQPVTADLPDPASAKIRLVILPSSLATAGGEAFQAWLRNLPAQRLLVPITNPDWLWVGQNPEGGPDLTLQAAQAARQMAEGQPIRYASPQTPWGIASTILAILFLVEVLFLILAMLSSILIR
jgi:Domain of unknown function (DUF5671)